MLSGRDPQPTKTLQPAQRRVHRIVPSFGTANGIRTTRIARLSRQSIVAAFAVALTKGMDGRGVQNIKPHRLNCRQALNNILKHAVTIDQAAKRAREKLIPRAEAGTGS